VANSPSSKKRARQSEKRRQLNASQRSMVRTFIKKIHSAVESGNYDNAQAAFLTAQPIIDSMVNKGIFPKNRAARIKSTLNGKVKALKA
jgi:small subunit ribosomal protein S20|tara:strand:+ start:1522 stop:1788 length:267 start_codon:yes stop_codon:yes gene_type:complete